MKLTLEQLSALPERVQYVTRLMTEHEVRAQGGRMGDSIQERIAPKFCAYKPSPDDVILFNDADGSWFVDYHLEGGPYKRRAYL